jgi:hypothetical protein
MNQSSIRFVSASRGATLSRYALRYAAGSPTSCFFHRAACVRDASVTLLSMIFNPVPIVDLARPWAFALKVGGAVLGIDLVAAAIYWRGSRRNVPQGGAP